VDSLEIIILAAAGVGLVAFVVLAVLLVRQGRAIRTLEERIGPPVPPAAAPSLERVRAVSAKSAPAQVVAVDDPGTGPDTPATAEDVPADPTVAPAPAAEPAPPTARGAEALRQAARDEERARKDAARRAKQEDRNGAADDEVASGRGLVWGAIAIVLIGLLGAGGWYLFVRDDGPSTAPTVQAGTTSTAAVTGEVPDDIPPLANKAAYTVAVLNASNVTGAAANKVAPRVQADGYTLGVVDNATKQGVRVSEVQYVKGRQEVGWNLARDLGITTALPMNALAQGRIGTADAVVIVGSDLAK
jgi:hypothetical protein